MYAPKQFERLWSIEPNPEDHAVFAHNLGSEGLLFGSPMDFDPSQLPRVDVLAANLEAAPADKYAILPPEEEALRRYISTLRPKFFFAFSHTGLRRERIYRHLHNLFEGLGYRSGEWRGDVSRWVPLRLPNCSVFRASRNALPLPPDPQPGPKQGWLEPIHPMISGFQREGKLPPSVARSVCREELALSPESYPVLIRAMGGSTSRFVTTNSEPAPAPKSSNPTYVRMVPGGVLRRVSNDAYKILCGFPPQFQIEEIERPIVGDRKRKWPKSSVMMYCGTIPPPLGKAFLQTLATEG